MTMTYKDLKESLKQNNIDNSAVIILELYMKDKEKFIKGLLLEECLPEPLQHDFEKHINVFHTFYQACEQVQEKLKDTNDEMPFFMKYMKLAKIILAIFDHNRSNVKELERKELFHYPFPQIIHMMCVFLENQSRLSQKELLSRQEESPYMDFFSGQVANIKGENGNISIEGNIEGNIETTKLILSYLFYKGKKALEKEIEQANDVSPYEIPSIEKIGLLGFHRVSLDRLWGLIKYRDWNFRLLNEYDEKKIIYFEPENINYFKLERTAVERYNYKEMSDLFKISNIRDEIFERIFENIFSIYNQICLNDVNSLFQIDEKKLKELIVSFKKLNDYSIRSLEFIDSSFWERKFIGKRRDTSFNELLSFISYLQAMGGVYSEKSYENFIDEDREKYKYLAPRIKKENFILHCSNILQIEKQRVEELFELFIYQPTPIQEAKHFSDLFSQPLVYFGKEEIIFVPMLIKQLNIPRIIEQHFSLWKIDDSEKGDVLEKYIRMVLGANPYLSVHPESLEIDAFDDRRAEFDFLGRFNEKILLIEMKCLRKPYSAKELLNREEQVFYGVEQVNRRAEIIQRDWDKIRLKAKIDLPVNPPIPENIIKVVCLNILDFTGKIKDGVIITDASSLTKYFVNPSVKKIELRGTIKKNVGEFSLWKKGYPTPTEFVEYLRNPITIKNIYDSLEETPRSFMLIESKNESMACLDYSLTKNPMEIINKNFQIKRKEKLKINNFKKNKNKKKQQRKAKKRNRSK